MIVNGRVRLEQIDFELCKTLITFALHLNFKDFSLLNKLAVNVCICELLCKPNCVADQVVANLSDSLLVPDEIEWNIF